MAEQKVNQREVWIDTLRGFACMCVLLVHSPNAWDGVTKGAYLLAPLNHILMSGGVCVFFMISGALLLAKEQPMVSFYRRRFSRVAIPVLFWSAVYVLIGAMQTGMSIDNVIKHIAMIPFASQTGMMWFMYVLCGIYLVTPILSSWLAKATKREVEIILAIWLFTTIVPYLQVIHPQFKEIVERTGLLFYFGGFLGYALLGFYLRKFSSVKVKSKTFAILMVFSVCLPVVGYAFPQIPKEAFSGSCNIAAVSLSAAIFVFFKQLHMKGIVIRLLVTFAKYSFGIYLCHMLFMRPLKLMLAPFHLHYAIQIPLTALVTGAITFVFVWMLSKVKYSNYIIG